MICVLASSSIGPRPGQKHFVLGKDTHSTVTVPLFSQVYKSVLQNLMLGNPAMDQDPIQGGSRNFPSYFTGLQFVVWLGADFLLKYG